VKILIILCLLLLNLVGWAAASPTQNMNVSCQVSHFTIALPANPTTGYQWKIKQYDKNLFSLQQSKYINPKANLMGAGGVMQFTFALKKCANCPEKSPIIFTYLRAWDLKSAQDTTVIISLKK
jgi:inhibitor of cysteine peptidase